MAVWGYARVWTEDQNLGLQVTALTEAGVPPRHIVREKASGKVGADRPTVSIFATVFSALLLFARALLVARRVNDRPKTHRQRPRNPSLPGDPDAGAYRRFGRR